MRSLEVGIIIDYKYYIVQYIVMHTLTPTHVKSILLKVITTHCIEKYNNVFRNIKKIILVVDKHFVWYLQLVCISLSSSK